MLFLYLSAVIVFAADQFTKWLAVIYLKPQGAIPVLPDVFHLTFVRNTGIAFGLFHNHPGVLTILIALSIAGLIVYAPFFASHSIMKRVAYGFIIGGALGNLCDRIRFQAVIDFLDFRIWPVFNLADTFITTGVVLFIIFSLKGSDAS